MRSCRRVIGALARAVGHGCARGGARLVGRALGDSCARRLTLPRWLRLVLVGLYVAVVTKWRQVMGRTPTVAPDRDPGAEIASLHHSVHGLAWEGAAKAGEGGARWARSLILFSRTDHDPHLSLRSSH
jgi:hypothetical protein